MSYNGFPSIGKSDHVVISVSIDFPSNSQKDVPFHRIAYEYSRADWDGLHDRLKDVPWKDVFKFGASAAASEFCEWFFSCLCCCHSSKKSFFYYLYRKNKSSDCKVKFSQASNHCKTVLGAAKLAYANKTKESSFLLSNFVYILHVH